MDRVENPSGESFRKPSGIFRIQAREKSFRKAFRNSSGIFRLQYFCKKAPQAAIITLF